MKDWAGQLDMAKVAWTLGHALATCLTLEVAINSAEAGIHETSGLDLASALLQHFGKLDLAYRSEPRHREQQNTQIKSKEKSKKRATDGDGLFFETGGQQHAKRTNNPGNTSFFFVGKREKKEQVFATADDQQLEYAGFSDGAARYGDAATTFEGDDRVKSWNQTRFRAGQLDANFQFFRAGLAYIPSQSP
ncbi:hypothetical protein BN14_07776 [Rhizoctonia solani AG-1 IB]|uniref:Uncharacterized protein n=1 Tax=Thanatephorus cucumeris (strain AG1-IB / isolate 7/3/14) TaxID=1108050 RepID=M5C2P9_THACB|nr:hypothetical protein BN14_07776 [Rhizoctonia solani AG-1 IB]